MCRIDEFALLIRALSLYGLDDLNFTHCSMRAEDGGIFVTSREGRPFWATTRDDIATFPGASPIQPNPQAHFNYQIHSLIPHAEVVIHTHSAAAIAVAGAGGLNAISQNSTLFTPDFLATVPYEVFEQDSIAANHCAEALMPERYALLLQGHGTLTVGRSIGEAFEIAYNLERACRIELACRASRSMTLLADEAVERGNEVWRRDGRLFGRGSWPALRDMLAVTPCWPFVRPVA